MSAIRPELQNLGAELVFVGSGSPEQAGWFVEDYDIEAPVYSDEPLAVYRALDARRGLLSSIEPRVLLRSLRAIRRGFRQTTTQGVAMQQGGVWILLPGHEMAFVYRSKYAGDHPSPGDVLDALESVTQAPRVAAARLATSVSG